MDIEQETRNRIAVWDAAVAHDPGNLSLTGHYLRGMIVEAGTAIRDLLAHISAERRSPDLTAIRYLMQELVNDRPSILDGTTSCKRCRALVLSENEHGHARWHNSIPPWD